MRSHFQSYFVCFDDWSGENDEHYALLKKIEIVKVTEQ